VERPEVVVIGGGLTGFSLAVRLHLGGKRVLLLESRSTIGGNLRTRTDENEHGQWLLDLGPNSFGDASKELIGLARDLGIEDRLVRAPDYAGKRFLFRNGGLVEVAAHPLKFLFSPLLPVSGRLRLMREPFISPRPADAREESLAEFCDRRLGKAARLKLLTPVVSGVYAGDPERLGAESAFPRMIALEREHGSLIRAAMKGSGPPSRGTLSSFDDGLELLPRAAQDLLGDSVRTDCTIESIERHGDAWKLTASDGFTVTSPTVAIAAPPHVTARLVEPIVPTVSAELDAIESPPMAVVHVGLPKDAIGSFPPGFGFLVPRDEGVRILGAIFSSQLFPGRSPDGHELLTIFTGGALDPAAATCDDAAVRDYVLSDLAKAFGDIGEPSFFSVYRWDRSIPQYVVGHKDRLTRIAAAMAPHTGLHILGNWRGGIAMPACVEAAEGLAARLLAD